MLEGGLGWSIASTRRERPRMSERRMNSCRTSEEICPTWTRKLRAAIHSFVLNRVSRAKSWRWVTRRSCEGRYYEFPMTEMLFLECRDIV